MANGVDMALPKIRIGSYLQLDSHYIKVIGVTDKGYLFEGPIPKSQVPRRWHKSARGGKKR